MQEKISTTTGSIILVIIATTIGVLTWKCVRFPDTNISVVKMPVQEKRMEISASGEKLATNQEEVETSASSEKIDPVSLKMSPEEFKKYVQDWNDCRNTKSGYSVKYPKEWGPRSHDIGGLLKTDSCNKEDIFFIRSDSKVGEGKQNLIQINYQSTLKGTGFRYEGSRSLDEYLEKVPETHKIREVLIANEKAVYIEDYPSPSVLVYHDSKIFFIHGKNFSEQAFTYFLTTFKFLK